MNIKSSVFDVRTITTDSMEILNELKKKKIISLVKVKNVIMVARCHVNSGKQSLLYKAAKEKANEVQEK